MGRYEHRVLLSNIVSSYLQKIFTCTAEWTVHHDARHWPVDRWVGSSTDNPRIAALLSFLVFKVAAESLSEGSSEVANDANVNGNVVFFGSGSERERMPLEV